MRVALFVTCVNDTLFPDTGRAVVTLLRRLGVDVDFPQGQACCGQMHLNTGYRPEATRLAERYAEVFAGYDAVVTPSGSCAAMIREHHESGASERTYDLSEFLVDVLGVTDVGAYFPHRVTYHPTCHSLRILQLGDRPRRLLESVRGLELTPLPGAEECCGFGGTFAVKNPDISAAMCGDKVRNIASTGAEVVCAADNSCLMHIGGTLSRQKLGVRAVHLAEILATTEAGR
ncbi:(Fe-S)-binding protein [Streptosporangiaceae bacterium NEAU-GS5]|nr:(Fe-S)-binding protein [Streptosporangiaceae bacterium NEAU-GS5]